MSGKEMVPWGTAVIGDVLSALQVPGGGFFGKLGDKYLERGGRIRNNALAAISESGWSAS
jgi:hypothetical protein